MANTASRAPSEGWWLTVKRPQKGKQGSRATYRICRQWTKPEGGTETETLELEEVNRVNSLLRTDAITPSDAELMIQAIRERLYQERDKAKPRRVHNRANLRILDRYLEDEYELRHIEETSKASMKRDLRRAVEAVGELALATATQRQLQKQIDSKYQDEPVVQRRVVTRLNSLLRYLDRGFRLMKMPDPANEVIYVTIEEFEKIATELARLPNSNRKRLNDAEYLAWWERRKQHREDFLTLAWVCIAIGCRPGEAFTITPNSVLSEDTVYIARATRRGDNSTKRTKTGKRRKAFVLEAGRHWLQRWFEIPEERKLPLRKAHHATQIKRAVRAARIARLTPEEVEAFTFYALRHSYAVHLLSKGVPVDWVSQYLGNTSDVCRKHYTGFIASDASLEMTRQLLNQA